MLPFVNGLKVPNISSIFFLHLEWIYIYICIYGHPPHDLPRSILCGNYHGSVCVQILCIYIYIYIYMCINIYIYIYHTVPVASG